MKNLFETGVVTKIKHGVKFLGQGSDTLTALSQSLEKPISLEGTDATASAIEAINGTGGSIEMNYRTPLILRQYLKPHKY